MELVPLACEDGVRCEKRELLNHSAIALCSCVVGHSLLDNRSTQLLMCEQIICAICLLLVENGHFRHLFGLFMSEP